jgi:hypothetical protein
MVFFKHVLHVPNAVHPLGGMKTSAAWNSCCVPSASVVTLAHDNTIPSLVYAHVHEYLAANSLKACLISSQTAAIFKARAAP